MGETEGIDIPAPTFGVCSGHIAALHRYTLQAPDRQEGRYDEMGNMQRRDNLLENTARHSPTGTGAGSTFQVALPSGALLGGEVLSGAAAGVLQAAGGCVP